MKFLATLLTHLVVLGPFLLVPQFLLCIVCFFLLEKNFSIEQFLSLTVVVLGVFHLFTSLVVALQPERTGSELFGLILLFPFIPAPAVIVGFITFHWKYLENLITKKWG